MIEYYNDDYVNILPNIKDKSINLILCDLPYGCTVNRWDTDIDLVWLWDQYKRILINNGNIILFSAQPFTTKLITTNPKMFKQQLIWEKQSPTGFLNAKKKHMSSHEEILVFAGNKSVYNPQGLKPIKNKVGNHKLSNNMRTWNNNPWDDIQSNSPFNNKTQNYSISNSYSEGITRKTGNNNCYDLKSSDGITKETTSNNIQNSGRPSYIGREFISTHTNYPRSILKGYKKDGKLHPTQKPVKLLEYLILTYSNENDMVLDNCMGVGSTLIASINTNRDCIGIEKEQKYYEQFISRL